MKIVRIIARLNVGGPARHVVWLTESLSDDDFESVLITGTVPEGEEDMSWFAEAHGVEPHYIAEMSRELSPKDAVSLWKVLKRLRAERPAIVHTHTAKAGTVGRVAAFLYKWLFWKDVKVVHTFHGHVFHSYYGRLKTSVFIAIEKVLAALATDRIIVISDRQRDEICDTFGVGSAGQFRVIPLGIDLSNFGDPKSRRRILRDELGISDDETLIGFVGRLTEIKNVHMLIRAAARLKDVDGLRFVIIGDGNMRTELSALADELGLGPKLIFAGNREDSDVFYAGLDAVALCSLNEGTPLTLIEAMANSLPFVSTAVGGVPDLAGPVTAEGGRYRICERGIISPSDDLDAYVDALRRMATDPALRVESGERGKRFVEMNYSRDRLVGDIRRLYQELASPNRRPA